MKHKGLLFTHSLIIGNSMKQKQYFDISTIVDKIIKNQVYIYKIFAIKALPHATDYEQFSRVECGNDQLNLFCQVAK